MSGGIWNCWLGRSPVDAVYSLITGKDCSLVRLEQGKSWCRPEEPPPMPQPYCTRSLGSVNCWRDPAPFDNPVRPVADGATDLTPEQEAHRTRSWPNWGATVRPTAEPAKPRETAPSSGPPLKPDPSPDHAAPNPPSPPAATAASLSGP